MITPTTVRNKKLRIIEQIDFMLAYMDRPDSGYNYIVDSMSVMQLQAIKGELQQEMLLEEREASFKLSNDGRQ